MILKIVDKKNEKAWIDYAAHVPTATLKEEVERCRRILEYDCLAAGYYAILPGFRYITDDRFHELPEEIQDIIRTGAWYQSPSMASSWPLEEDDEQDVMDRDLRLEEPWKYFEDLDEFLIYEAETAEIRERKRRHDSRAGQGLTGQGGAASKCAGGAGQGDTALCAVIIKTDAPDAKCGCPENGRMSGAGRDSHGVKMQKSSISVPGRSCSTNQPIEIFLGEMNVPFHCISSFFIVKEADVTEVCGS